MLPLPVLYPVWRALLAAVDRWFAPPIMRRRINAGSDEYFAWLEQHAGDSELDELAHRGGSHDDADDS